MDKAALQYNEKLFRSWLVNSYTTTPVGPRDNVSKVYAVAYNVKKVFKAGARTFSDFKDDVSESGKFYEELYQFFWACVQRTWLVASGGSAKKKRKGRGGGDEDARDHDGARGERTEGESGNAPDDSDLEPFERASSDSTAPHRGRPPGASSWNDEPAMEVYLEAVMPEGLDGDDPSHAGAGDACAYRFWVLLRSSFSVEDGQAMILEENAEMCKGGAPGQGKRRRGAVEGMACSTFEKYRKIRKKSDLAVLADLYMDTQYMQRNVDAVNDPTTPITSPNNPLCAKHLFGPASAFLHCGPGVAPDQGPSSLSSYISAARASGVRVRFPRPRYVMRLYPDQCSVEAMCSKYLPHYQQNCAHPIASAYPEFFPWSPAHVPSASSGNQLDEAQRRLGELLADEGNPHLNSTYGSARDALLRGGGGGGDGGANFAVYAAEVMELEREFPFFELRDAASGFKRESLTIRQRLQDMQELVNSPMMQYYHKSELAQIADEGRAVKDVIDRALSDAVGEVDRLTRDPATSEEWSSPTDVPDDPNDASPSHSVNKAKEYCSRARHRARVMYLINQKFLFKQYENRCRSAQSNISDVGRSMHDFRVRSSLYDHDVKHYKIDRSLTTTSNMFITMIEQYQSVFYVSSKHVHLLVCDLARLDASRHAFNLHWNVLTHSHQGGQSKSFMWSIVEEISIEGSTFTLSYQTRRADNVDGDKNDLIRIFNEVPYSMLFGSGSGPDDQTGPMKDLLTSCVSRVYLFDAKKYEETGARANRMAVSECVGVWFGSYNDSPAKIEDAMRSRFTFLGCERTVDPVRNTQDLMYAESLRAAGQSVVRKKTVVEKRLIQMMFFEVNKLIQIGALAEPSLEACTTVFLMVDHMLEKEGHKPASGRLFEQQCIIARTIVIYDAIDRHFFVPCAEHFGKPVTLEAFRGLDRKLVGFAHHAAMALSLSIDQLIDPMEAEVVSAITKFHRSDHRYRNSFARKRWSNPDQGVADAQPQRGQPHVRKDHIYGGGPASRLPDCGFVGRNEYDADHNYICFDNLSGRSKNEAIRDFAVTLSAFMDSGALGNRTKPSPQAIFDVVKGLKRRTFRCRAYRKKPDADFSEVDAVEEDPQSAGEHRSICVDDKDSVSFLCAYVNRPVETGRQMLCRVLRSILGMRHQEKKTLILGIADDATPNVLQTLAVGAEDPSSPELPDMAIPNAAFMSELERVVVYGRPDGPSVDPLKMKKSIILNVDLDVWAVSRRNDTLFVSGYRVDPGDLSPPWNGRVIRGGALRGEEEGPRRYFLGLDVTDYGRGGEAGPTPSQNLESLRSLHLEEFDGSLPDEDMGDPSSYVVASPDGAGPVPHWDLFGSGRDGGGSGVKPYVYKLQRDHWKVTEHMESLVDYGDRPVFSYPQDVQRRGASRQEVWDGAAAMCDGPDSRYVSLRDNPECFVRGLPSMAMMEPYNSYMNPASRFISAVPGAGSPAPHPPRPPDARASGEEGSQGAGDDRQPPQTTTSGQSTRAAYGKAFALESANARKNIASEMLEEAYGAIRAAKDMLHGTSNGKKPNASDVGSGKSKKTHRSARSEKPGHAEVRDVGIPSVKTRYNEKLKK